MITAIRLIFTAIWGAAACFAVRAGANGSNAEFLVYCGVLLLLSVPMSVFWTPLLGNLLFGTTIDSVNRGHRPTKRYQLEKWIARAALRKQHRRVVLLCFIEVLIRPRQPRPFHVGMKHARSGSWMELFFARTVVQFSNARHVMEAAAVLDRHGIHTTNHPSEHITQLLRYRKRHNPPAKPPIPVPPTPAPEAPKRNPRIKLFASASQPADEPPAQPAIPPVSSS